ncbi:MAG: DNA repair protein RadA, partial [Micrococcales bacterium]|nr:DNA repair protein RadA [Micrococcales bacterium]
SAAQDKPLPQRLVCFGEVGLAGEVRPVPGIEQRIREVARLGFTHAVVPASPQGLSSIPDGFRVREVTSLVEALQIFFPPS